MEPGHLGSILGFTTYSYVTSLYLSFFICKWELIIVLTHKVVKIKRCNVVIYVKILRPVSGIGNPLCLLLINIYNNKSVLAYMVIHCVCPPPRPSLLHALTVVCWLWTAFPGHPFQLSSIRCQRRH